MSEQQHRGHCGCGGACVAGLSVRRPSTVPGQQLLERDASHDTCNRRHDDPHGHRTQLASQLQGQANEGTQRLCNTTGCCPADGLPPAACRKEHGHTERNALCTTPASAGAGQGWSALCRIPTGVGTTDSWGRGYSVQLHPPTEQNSQSVPGMLWMAMATATVTPR